MKWCTLLIASAIVVTACTTTTRPGVVGIERQQLMLVSTEATEHISEIYYREQYNKAYAQRHLITNGYDYNRLRKIAGLLIKQSVVFRDDTMNWKWDVTLIDAPTINASCVAGGKITFYTGIIRRLQLTDDEIAAIMGHEIAHALREHARERLSQAIVQNLITNIALAAIKNRESEITLANQAVHYLYMLPHSREEETEADKIGVELAARAGYDPRAAINVWRKMEAVSRGSDPPEFLSTHPSHATRIAELSALMPKVVPLYEATQKP